MEEGCGDPMQRGRAEKDLRGSNRRAAEEEMFELRLMDESEDGGDDDDEHGDNEDEPSVLRGLRTRR